jgi:lysozyme
VTLREQLERDEGREGYPYRDSLGFLTIGVGHNLDANPLPDEVINLLLDIDIARVQGALRIRVPWYQELSEPRQAVLEGMAYNMGVGGLMTFHKLLRACEGGDYTTAAAEMLDSRWAKQVPVRAMRLAAQMRTGEWV